MTNKKKLDGKYSYSRDDNGVLHLYRNGEKCDSLISNPLISAIYNIEQLEEDNKELKKKLKEKLKTIADKDLSFVAKFDALERENAELKTDYEVLSCSVGDFGELQEKLEEEQRKNNGLSDKLIKAKEIIKAVVDFYPTTTTTTLCEAEQFLSEAEK